MNIWKLYVFNPEIPGTPRIKPVGSIPRGAQPRASDAPRLPALLARRVLWRCSLTGICTACMHAGMPSITAGWWFPLFDVPKQLILSLIICILDIVESTSIARALAQKNKYRLNQTQELRGLGLANLGGAIFK
jgi:hypothetical protein